MNCSWILLAAIVINAASGVRASSMTPVETSIVHSQAGSADTELYGSRQGKKKPGYFKTAVPPHDLDVVLGRPTFDSVTMSLMAPHRSSGFINYGAVPENLDLRLFFELSANKPEEIEITGLIPDTRYHYQLQVRNKDNDPVLKTGSFSTQRSSHNSFSFSVQADSHLDQNTDTEWYLHTLKT